MYFSYRKRLLACVIVLFLCLWVIFKTSQLAVQYDLLVNSLQWEVERCIHKQGLDPKGRLGPDKLYTRYIDGVPEGLYTVSPALLDHSNRAFTTRAPTVRKEEISHQLQNLLPWPLTATTASWPSCTHYYDEAFVFTLPIPHSEDWYYQTHVHTLLPLYQLLSHREHLGPHSTNGYTIVLLPGVESVNLKSMDWESELFAEEQDFGVFQELLRTFAGVMKIIPLTQSSLSTRRYTCFTTVHFGVGTMKAIDPYLLESFKSLIHSRLSLPDTAPTTPLVCLAVRMLNRRIKYIEPLKEAVRRIVPVQTLQFHGLSFREQVSQMQLCTVLVGVHGDELVNAIYMPQDSVTIQLLPLNNEGLNPELYSDIAKSKGPYLEWRIKQESSSKNTKDKTDIVVDVEQLLVLVREALTIGINKRFQTVI